jgi:hypothetical protein
MEWVDADCIHLAGLFENANENLSGTNLPSNRNLKMDSLISAVI